MSGSMILLYVGAIVLVVVTTLLRIWLYYRNYLRARISMEKGAKEMVDKMVLLKQKNPDSVDSLAAFRQQYHEYTLDRRSRKKAAQQEKDESVNQLRKDAGLTPYESDSTQS
ncbi:hypothetical protein HOH87_04610 [bacterium]|nr:hypothetical protein [bacterium]